jgi:hypothetical protein
MGTLAALMASRFTKIPRARVHVPNRTNPIAVDYKVSVTGATIHTTVSDSRWRQSKKDVFK